MTFPHLPNAAKPLADDPDFRRNDLTRRPFHRINAPDYDLAVDTNDNRRGAKRPPLGRAKESGARGPEAFQASGFLEHFARLAAKLLKSGLLAIPIIGQGLAILDAAIKALTGKSPIEELFAALAKLVSTSVESALFARLLRAIPAWVPVGRVGYTSEFRYQEDGATRVSQREEEREIEGFLTASYALPNDVVFSQWDRFRHWAFHVLPTPGHRYLIGEGNVPDPAEREFINKTESRSNQPTFAEVLRIYGQQRLGADPDRGAIECLLDVGAISRPPGDQGFHGVHFSQPWPYWPMAGDYFWAAGRWTYDCMRATLSGKTEIFPTQLNPIKAFAAARVEGFKFQENPKPSTAVRFLFLASSEGGFKDFRTVPGRKGPAVPSQITLRDKNYEFIVDLPPHELGRSPNPIGSTIEFALNTIVLRPRLLIQVRQAPFSRFGLSPKFAEGLQARAIEPKIEILRPADPNQRPSQVKVTIPLKDLPAPSSPDAKEMVGLDIALGWHDPVGEEERSLVQVKAAIHFPRFYGHSGRVRMATAINGRWNLLAEEVDDEASEPPVAPPPPNARKIQEVMLLLPKSAPVSITASGIWFHGFGEFIEGDTLDGRRLFVGGLLLNVDNDTKKKLKGLIDDARKMVQDLKDLGQNLKEPKEKLKADLKKRIEEERKKGTDPRALAELEKQLNALVDGLPDTPANIKSALADLDRRLGGLLEVFDSIEEFLKITDDLIGERYFPHWQEDIDAAQKAGVEESKRVSAIARTMFIHPTPVINQHDEPMGWVEFIDETRGTLGRSPINTQLAPSPFRLATAGALLALAKQNSRNRVIIRMVAPPFTQAGSGNNLARRINPPQEASEYEFAVVLEVHDHPFPLRTSDDPDLT